MHACQSQFLLHVNFCSSKLNSQLSDNTNSMCLTRCILKEHVLPSVIKVCRLCISLQTQIKHRLYFVHWVSRGECNRVLIDIK